MAEEKNVDKGLKSNTIVYTIPEAKFLAGRISWSPLKSARLKRLRGTSFEEIIRAKLLDIRKHPSRSNQGILIYEYKWHIWVVPFVAESEGIFLKTLYPSRKYRRLYKEEVQG